MNQADNQYKYLVEQILEHGETKTSRGGSIASTIDYFGLPQMSFDLRAGFPLLTTKKIEFSNIIYELCWMLRGETNINTLKAPQIWKDWADENGDLGPIYGQQMRFWAGSGPVTRGGSIDGGGEWIAYGHDQIANLIKNLKENPDSRRLIVNLWNVDELDKMKLPPCHMFFQCSVIGENLDLKLYQRSADTALGVPYNIAFYALLTHMLAKEAGLKARRFIHTFGSAHIYDHHVDKLKEQMERKPKTAPQLKLADKSFWDLIRDEDPADFLLENYDPHPFIKYKVEV